MYAIDREHNDEVSCPVCARQCLDTPLYRYTSSEAAAHFCPVSRDPNRFLRLKDSIERLWEGDKCCVYRCADCGFGFGLPFVGGDEEFYEILHEQKAYPAWRWDYDVAISEAINKFEGGKILDLGAGLGSFLRGLSSSWTCFAVEGSEATRSELERSGIVVVRDLAAAVRQHAATFRVVTLFQVLEHLADFDQVIRQCRELLSPGGRLVVTVPDGDAMIRQERLTGCHDMPPNHINKWTSESLSLVFRRAGLECSPPIYEPPSWKHLTGSLHLRVAADAANEQSFAAQVYRIRNRPLRIAAMGLLGNPTLFRILPHCRQLTLGGAFAMIGVVPR